MPEIRETQPASATSRARRLITLEINSKTLLACLLIAIIALPARAQVEQQTHASGTRARADEVSKQQPQQQRQETTRIVAINESDHVSGAQRSPQSQSAHELKQPVGQIPGAGERRADSRQAQQQQQQQQQQTSKKKCDYDKGQWGECEPNGSQQKVMRLRGGGPDCKPTKTVRRDCKTSGELGCKYARGDWSSECQEGLRVRVDTLMGSVGANELAPSVKCKPQRRVTKDCRRTCHYNKSAWSECVNGAKTRVLTLDQTAGATDGPPVLSAGDNPSATPRASTAGTEDSKVAQEQRAAESKEIKNNKAVRKPRDLAATTTASKTATTTATMATTAGLASSQICAPRKVIRRECSASAAPKTTAGQAGKLHQLAQQQRQNQQQQQAQPKERESVQAGTGANLTPVQRRRLKQLQLKQQQPSAKLAAASSSTVQPPTAIQNSKIRGQAGRSVVSVTSDRSAGGTGNGAGVGASTNKGRR